MKKFEQFSNELSINDIKEILVDFVDTGFKTHAYYTYNGGICIDIRVRNPLPLDSNLLISLQTTIEYLKLKGYSIIADIDGIKMDTDEIRVKKIFSHITLICE